MNIDPSADGDLSRIQEALRVMPDREPPRELLPGVMASLRAKELPLWTRLLRWSRAPRSLTFVPLHLAYGAAVVAVLALGAVLYGISDEKQHLTRRDAPVPVVLVLRAPDARQVAVIGSFNGWMAQKCEPQLIDGIPHWSASLLLPAGRYEYAFVVDGETIVPDPGAGLQEDDGYGNRNAILLVGNGHGNSG